MKTWRGESRTWPRTMKIQTYMSDTVNKVLQLKTTTKLLQNLFNSLNGQL